MIINRSISNSYHDPIFHKKKSDEKIKKPIFIARVWNALINKIVNFFRWMFSCCIKKPSKPKEESVQKKIENTPVKCNSPQRIEIPKLSEEIPIVKDEIPIVSEEMPKISIEKVMIPEKAKQNYLYKDSAPVARILKQLKEELEKNVVNYEKIKNLIFENDFTIKGYDFEIIIIDIFERAVKDKKFNEVSFLYNIDEDILKSIIYRTVCNANLECVKLVVNTSMQLFNVFELSISFNSVNKETIFDMAVKRGHSDVFEYFLSLEVGRSTFSKIPNHWEILLAKALCSVKTEIIAYIMTKKGSDLDANFVISQPTYDNNRNPLEIYVKLVIQGEENMDPHLKNYTRFLELLSLGNKVHDGVFGKPFTMREHTWENYDKFQAEAKKFMETYRNKIYQFLEDSPLHKGTSMNQIVADYLFRI